jgi:6-pyruvoyltetrahydropterin/6-carboxytetrahydropterin synthase
MYTVTKRIRFCYGHRLLDYEGPCQHLHGHNGLLEITFGSETLDRRGMVIDFDEIKGFVKKWVDDTLDHRMLLSRDDPYLAFLREAGEPHHVFDGNPTAENIARLIFNHAKSEGYPVLRVRLWETDNSWAEYSEGPVR